MAKRRCVLILAGFLIAADQAFACEPVVPFMQVMVPALALSGSLLVLLVAVIVKSVLFSWFEPSLPHVPAAVRMFLGNVLTSIIGLLVAAMIASSPGVWVIGVPLAFLFCWLPSRRLVKVAPLAWLARVSPFAVAATMTLSLLASCILFMVGREAVQIHRLALYWTVKLLAIALALFASVTLTSIWEEWAIWRLSSRPDGSGFFASVVRTNLYVLILVLAIPAVLILPKRLKSPDFLARHPNGVVARAVSTSH